MELKDFIQKAAGGDDEAFEWIVRNYQQKMFAFCCVMLGHRQEAEDAVQEIFIKAYRKLDGYDHRSDGHFLAWLYKVASNHCRSQRRKRKLWNALLPLIHQERSEKSAEEAFREQWEGKLSHITCLSADEKELLALRVIEDQSYEDIAKLIGIRSAAVRKRFERMKRKLNEERGSWHGARMEKQWER